MMQSYVIYGAGGFCKVILDLILAVGGKVECIFDDFPEKSNYSLMGIKVVKYDRNIFPDAQLIIAIGNNEVRQALSKSLTHQFATIIHPTASVSTFASIGKGSMILANAIVQAEAILGVHVIVNPGVCIDHEVHIGDFVHIGALVYIGGAAKVGELSNIRPGALVKRSMILPDHSYINPNEIIQ